MANIFTTAFVINGILGSSFTSATNAARTQMNKITLAIQGLRAEQKILDKAYNSGVISVDTYNRHLSALQTKVGATQQSYKNLQATMSAKIQARNNFASAGRNLSASIILLKNITAPFASMVKTAAEFEAGMSKVKAITGANETSMKLLTAQAKELGRTTKFSATQSAEAMSYLGMAGWDTQQILKGMPALLSLAAAGGTDLARTADIVSDNLTAFGLAADKSMHMADVYATVISSTNTNIEMLGDTMKYAAPVAHAFGASMEETAALAGLMANSGIKASQAGTALRAGFLRLAGPPKMAQKAMDSLGMSMNDITADQKEAAMAMASLGIQMSDINGQKKMSAILKELRNKTKDLGEEQKLAAMKAIFGQEAATGWLSVLNSGDEVFEKLVKALEKSDGAANKMAKTMNENAKGALTAYNSAMESLSISIANTFLPALADVAQTMATLAGGLAEFAEKHETLTKTVIYLSGAVAGLWLTFKGYDVATSAFALLKSHILDLRDAVNRFRQSAIYAKVETIALAMWQKITAAYTLGLAAANKVYAASCTIVNGAISLTTKVIGGLRAAFVVLRATMMANPWIALATVAVGAALLIYKNWDTVKEWFTTLWDNPALALQKFADGVKDILGGVYNWIKQKWESISNFLSTPIFGKINVMAETAQTNAAKVGQNATGGIYNKGAFLTTFAEKSGESAIPHIPNARNIGLLAQTNAIMGNPLGVGNKTAQNGAQNATGGIIPNARKFNLLKESNSIRNNTTTTGGNITASFAPQITINGGSEGSKTELDALMSRKMQEFEEMLKRVNAQQRRLSYG